MQCVVERLGALQSALDSIGLSQVILRHSYLSVSVFNYKMSESDVKILKLSHYLIIPEI